MKTAAERVRARRARLRAAGICTVCGSERAQVGQTMCSDCRRETYDRVRWHRIRAGVERRLERALGTTVTEGAIDGRYGRARFLSHASKSGVLQYQIMTLGPIRRRKTLDFVWRETTAKVIAQQLIAAYATLVSDAAA